MAAGRKPKPTHLKIVQGNPGKRKINKDSEDVFNDYLLCPEFLSDNQKVIWNDAINNAPKGLLKSVDLSVLCVWVVAFDIFQQANKEIEKTGLVITEKGHNGNYNKQSDYISIINKQAAIMIKASAEMGFTPSSRSRVSIDPGIKKDSKFGKFG